jgi:hypothetical protein
VAQPLQLEQLQHRRTVVVVVMVVVVVVVLVAAILITTATALFLKNAYLNTFARKVHAC